VTSAIKKFLIFSVAVLAFVGVRFVSEQWFYFPDSLAMALGFFAMGVIIKPLAAPDLPMSRWLVIPLGGMAIGLVILTAPRWYEDWTAPDRTLPDFLPTEEDFAAQVIYYAEGSTGDASPRNCGSFGAKEDPAAGRRCALDALASEEAFYLFYFPGAIDTVEREALASSGGGTARRFHYSRDSIGPRPRASISSSYCPDARFIDETAGVQCGPWPTPWEFRETIRVGTDCGQHGAIYDVTFAKGREQIDCVMAALESREAFHYQFDSDWGEASGIVDGALSWDPATQPLPVLSFYVGSGAPDEAQRILIQRACEAPKIRLVKPTSPNLRRDGRDSSVEIDCGDATFPSR
jgi:hypothetical protein